MTSVTDLLSATQNVATSQRIHQPLSSHLEDFRQRDVPHALVKTHLLAVHPAHRAESTKVPSGTSCFSLLRYSGSMVLNTSLHSHSRSDFVTSGHSAEPHSCFLREIEIGATVGSIVGDRKVPQGPLVQEVVHRPLGAVCVCSASAGGQTRCRCGDQPLQITPGLVPRV